VLDGKYVSHNAVKKGEFSVAC